MGGIEKFRVFFVLFLCLSERNLLFCLAAFSTDATSQLNVLGHDRHTFGVNGAQVGILKQADEVGFRCLLESKDCRSLKAQITLEILSNLTNQALEGQLANEQVGRLLVAPNLAESDSTRTVTVRLLDTTSRGGGLSGCLGGKLLSGSLATSGLTSGLLGTGHVVCFLTNQLDASFVFVCYV